LKVVGRARRVLGRGRRRLTIGATLFFGDVLAGWLALAASQVAVHLAFAEPISLEWTQPRLVLLMLVFLTLGLYSGSAQCPYARFRTRCMGILLFVALDAFVTGPAAGAERLALTGMSAGAFLIVCSFYMELLLRHILVRAGLWTAPTVIIGCGAAAQKLYETFLAQPDLGFRPVGFVRTPADAQAQGADLPTPVLGNIEDFARLSKDSQVAILTSADQVGLIRADTPRSSPIQLILLSDTSNIGTLWLSLRPLGSGVGIQLERTASLSQNRFLKRAIDLAIAIPAGILVLPLVGVLSLIISLFNRGSPLYWQPRVGERGRSFDLPKLRTMYGDAASRLAEHLANDPAAKEEWQRYFKLSNDPRVLPFIGNFMRRTSLDELPQLWSVIVGDMSLVGPRPFPQYHINSFDAEFQQIRTMVPPGLTGFWQVTSRSNGDLDVQRAQDTFYIRNWSIWLDLYIMFQTLPAVVGGNGAK
jgi:Undecaprenyl-phosphate galactose phosphotransferase WbaP